VSVARQRSGDTEVTTNQVLSHQGQSLQARDSLHVGVADPSRQVYAAELSSFGLCWCTCAADCTIWDVKVLCRAAATMDQEAVALWKSVLQRLNSTDITSITGRGGNISVATLELSEEINKLATLGSL